MLVVSDDGTHVDTGGLADALRTFVSPVPRLSETGASWLVGAGVAVRQARWIVVVAALACLFAAVMGSATLLAEVVRMRRRHRVFAVYAGGLPRHLALGAGLVGPPCFWAGSSAEPPGSLRATPQSTWATPLTRLRARSSSRSWRWFSSSPGHRASPQPSQRHAQRPGGSQRAERLP